MTRLLPTLIASETGDTDETAVLFVVTAAAVGMGDLAIRSREQKACEGNPQFILEIRLVSVRGLRLDRMAEAADTKSKRGGD